ncbi:uncharacterized protein hemgn isoform X4 [Lampris incognitus]|uniref:uncharacterized protein hemgn isoform X4 n=1 Tax=Lampris incognitus TaxID=2546036 RepID=UPI0024B5ABE3|nr:uncharacterized protein hemgn isoform X4 [Lampris incognitus]
MEETLQKEKGESELKTSDGNQGGVQRRLRDRELLRKRKAEAEEKETIQVESRRKRPRGEQKSSAASATPPEDEPAPVPDPAPSEALSQGPVLASVGTLSVPSPSSLYTESQGSADLVLIEDIGSDEDEDISLFQEKRAAAELSEEPTVSVLEQNNIFSNPTLNSPPPPSEYLPGN